MVFVKTGNVYKTSTTYQHFIQNIAQFAKAIFSEVKTGIFEIDFGKTVLTQGGGRENIMLKRIKDGTVLAVVFFGSRDDTLGSAGVSCKLIENKIHELMRQSPVLFDIIMSMSKGSFGHDGPTKLRKKKSPSRRSHKKA
jgi:hypothetical protein